MEQQGYFRVVVGTKTVDLSEGGLPLGTEGPLWVIVDRVTLGTAADSRLTDSLEAAFDDGGGECCVFVSADASLGGVSERNVEEREVDGRRWQVFRFSRSPLCAECGVDYAEPEPRLFSFNSPLGACPKCEGIGAVPGLDIELVAPNGRKTLAAGAIAAWEGAAYAKQRESPPEIGSEGGDSD